jgi:hypothetical protein
MIIEMTLRPVNLRCIFITVLKTTALLQAKTIGENIIVSTNTSNQSFINTICNIPDHPNYN